MTCQDIEQSSIAERYLTNGLSGSDRDAFEEHYFACDSCFARLEALRIARQELVAARPKRRPGYVWAVAAIAAMIALACGLAIELRSHHPGSGTTAAKVASGPQAGRELLALARFDPPGYHPPEMRSAVTPLETRFESAMQPYIRGDYAAAARSLTSFLATEPNDIRARFYLGACELLVHDPRGAAADLERAVSAGDSPFLEEAHSALAKAELQIGDIQAARIQLQLAANMHGDFEPQARKLLSTLDRMQQ